MLAARLRTSAVKSKPAKAKTAGNQGVTVEITLNALIGNVHPPALHDIVAGHVQVQADSRPHDEPSTQHTDIIAG